MPRPCELLGEQKSGSKTAKSFFTFLIEGNGSGKLQTSVTLIGGHIIEDLLSEIESKISGTNLECSSKATAPGHLRNQLLRAASSITINLGEAYGSIQKGAIHILVGDSSKLPPLK